MKINVFNKEIDYKELCQWWDKHKHPIIPRNSLPYGIVIENDKNEKLCASFLYTFDGCDMCQIGWVTSNPNLGLKERYEAIDLALDALILYADKIGKKNIVCFSNSKGLSKMFFKKGFSKNSAHDLMVGGL